MFTLRRLLTNVKDEDEREDWPGAVYKTNDSTARWDRGKKLTSRLNEHKLATKKGDLNSAEHHLKTSHMHYLLGLCYGCYLHYRLLSTNYTRKLVYKSLSTSSRTAYKQSLKRKQ